ncbi:MAG: PQQ-binding-like beta-propeller repeat protein [Bacteroidota bacterium]
MKFKITLLFCLFLVVEVAFSQREMWMSSTDKNIIKRAQQQPEAIFQLPLGHQLLDQMQLINDKTLLVGLRENTPQLRSSSYMAIASDSGKIYWQYVCEKGDYSTYWISDVNIVLKREEKKKTSFICLDLKTGNPIWGKSYPKTKTGFILEPDSEALIIYSILKGVVSLAAISLESGESRWDVKMQTTWTNTPFVLLDEGKAYIFSDEIKVVDTKLGEVTLTLDAKKADGMSPFVPSFDETHIFFINSENTLFCTNKQSGEMQWKIELPTDIKFTNITPREDTIYIQGEGESSHFHVVSILKENGEIQWSHLQEEASTSNLIENEDSLYFASSSSLFAMNNQTGKVLFTKSVTKTGRKFPVSLRIIENQIVFVSELVIAGYDKTTGKLRYKHGFSPIHINLHYNGLDSSLPKLKQELEGQENYENSGVAQMASNQRAYYQKMADKNYSDYLKYRSQNRPGLGYKTNMARYRSRMYSSMARMQAGLSVSFAILELGSALEQLLQANATQAEIRKQEYYRKSILDVYTLALSENYVFRPNLKYYSYDDQYVCVSIVNLTTGKKKNHLVSPQYLEYGLWNLIDFEKGIIYHHGVGMDPKKYKISKSRRTPLVKFKTVETFLVAQPFSLN